MFDTEKFISEVRKRPSLYDVHCKDYINRDFKTKLWAEIGNIMYTDWNSVSDDTREVRGKEMIKKWKAIRDNFVKDLKFLAMKEIGQPVTQTKKKRYLYYDHLHFLEPYLKINVATATNRVHHSTDTDVDAPEINDTHEQDSVGDTEPNQLSTTKPSMSFSRTVSACKRKNSPQMITSDVNSKLSRLESLPSSNNSPLTTGETSYPAIGGIESDIYGHRAFLMSFVPILNNLPLHAAIQARLEISQVISENYFRSSQRYNCNLDVADSPDTRASFQTDDSSEDLTFQNMKVAETENI